MLGTLVAVGAQGGDHLDSAVAAAFAAVARVEALMRPNTPGSDVWRICAAAPGRAVQIDPWTVAVLELARRFHRDSGGVFDPCRPTRPGRLIDLELRAPASVVCHASVALDLGGIAKGFAVDRAVDELESHGCMRGIVNAGGDLRCFGPGAHAVSLRTDEDAVPEALRIELSDCALAVSGARSERSPSEHVGYYVGTTGEAAAGHWTAVLAPQAAAADALCKCVMLASPAVATSLLLIHRARLVRG
jgi:FAD:protein FMN transferase